MITIRKYQQGDELALREIFFNTIRQINIKDYSPLQVQAWAPENFDPDEWRQRMQAINPFIALLGDVIVGYADIQDDGYIDHFFCHYAHQGKGIGKTLMKTLAEEGQKKGIVRFYSHASITARPFFEHFGFAVIKAQRVEVRGQILSNFVMEKVLTAGSSAG